MQIPTKPLKTDQLAEHTEAEAEDGQISYLGAFELKAAAHEIETQRVRKVQLQMERDALMQSLQFAGPKRSLSLWAQIKEVDKAIEICQQLMDAPEISLDGPN